MSKRFLLGRFSDGSVPEEKEENMYSTREGQTWIDHESECLINKYGDPVTRPAYASRRTGSHPLTPSPRHTEQSFVLMIQHINLPRYFVTTHPPVPSANSVPQNSIS